MSELIVQSDEIERAYQESGNRLGWRLLASPARTLAGAEIAFIGLNPAGRIEPLGHPRFAPESGSAYCDEVWGNAPAGESRLQRQVLALFKALNVAPENVLAGNLIPFRSPSFECLRNREGSLKFGADLWSRIIRRARPSLVIVMGREVEKAVVGALSAELETKEVLGWGNPAGGQITGRRWKFDGGLIVFLPHLSRFGVVTRKASQAGLAALFGARWTT